MIQQHIQSSEQNVLPEDFENANAIIQSIAQPRDSQPTKTKVKNFKNRVFNLLKIYTTHSTDINPLIKCLKQEMFLREPQKMKELINDILNKQNIALENLQQLLEYYKVILLYKGERKNVDDIAVDFIRVLKKISHLDCNLVKDTLVSMLRSFAFERKCHLNINFFLYFFRKYQNSKQIKHLLIENCQQFMNDEKLRNAQKKQLSKLLTKIDKSTKVKVKKQENQSEDEDDIKAVPNQNNLKIKKEKHEDKLQNKDKIEEEGEQNSNPKKEMSLEQQEKLQRIKANKKKNRKQNQKSNKNTENQNKNTENQTKNQNPEKKNNNQQRTESKQRSVQEQKGRSVQKQRPVQEQKERSVQKQRPVQEQKKMSQKRPNSQQKGNRNNESKQRNQKNLGKSPNKNKK